MRSRQVRPFHAVLRQVQNREGRQCTLELGIAITSPCQHPQPRPAIEAGPAAAAATATAALPGLGPVLNQSMTDPNIELEWSAKSLRIPHEGLATQFTLSALARPQRV